MSKPELPSLEGGQDDGLPAALASSRERAGLARVVSHRVAPPGGSPPNSEHLEPSPRDSVRLERQLVNFQADFMDVLRRLQDLEAAVKTLRSEVQSIRDRSLPD